MTRSAAYFAIIATSLVCLAAPSWGQAGKPPPATGRSVSEEVKRRVQKEIKEADELMKQNFHELIEVIRESPDFGKKLRKGRIPLKSICSLGLSQLVSYAVLRSYSDGTTSPLDLPKLRREDALQLPQQQEREPRAP